MKDIILTKLKNDPRISCKNLISNIFSPIIKLFQNFFVNIVIRLWNLSLFILCKEKVSANFRIKQELRGLTLLRSFRPTAINITFYKSRTVAASSPLGSQGRRHVDLCMGWECRNA